MLEWGDLDDRLYHTGTDRGVLYLDDTAVVWNGLTGVSENSDSSSTVLYVDGNVYYAGIEPGDFKGTVTAFFFPDEFSEALGMPEVADGFYVDNQKPKQFGLSYRSLIGSGTLGDMFGYQIHLVYNALASFPSLSRKTVNNTPSPIEMSFDLVCKPVALPGYRPSAHYVIDTRHLDGPTIQSLEDILYEEKRMPTPLELHDLLNFGSSIVFEKFVHPELGECWTATGAYENVHMTSPTTWVIKNVNGTDNGDGTYILEDTL